MKGLRGIFGRSEATVAAAPASAPLESIPPEELAAERESATAAFQVSSLPIWASRLRWVLADNLWLQAIDIDGDGTLDSQEVRRLLLDLGREATELDEAALALAMAEMRGGGGGKTPVPTPPAAQADMDAGSDGCGCVLRRSIWSSSCSGGCSTRRTPLPPRPPRVAKT